MTSEEKLLNEKINTLIDQNLEMGNKIYEQSEHILELKEENSTLKRLLKNKADCAAPEDVWKEESEIFFFMRDFCQIVRLLFMDDAMIPYRYGTRNSLHFYKVDKGGFDEYVRKYSALQLHRFIHYCVDLSLIKAEQNGKCVYTSCSQKIYYIKRTFADAAAKGILRPGGG